jgi:hypothetical protein
LSRYGYICAPSSSKSIRASRLGGNIPNRRDKQITEPRGLAPLDTQCLAKDTRLMAPAHMRRVETIVLQLCDIEDNAIEGRQSRHRYGNS